MVGEQPSPIKTTIIILFKEKSALGPDKRPASLLLNTKYPVLIYVGWTVLVYLVYHVVGEVLVQVGQAVRVLAQGLVLT